MSFPTAFHGNVLPRNYRQFEDGAPAAPLSLPGQGVFRYNDTTKTFQVSIDGGAYQDVPTGSGGAVEFAVAVQTSNLTLTSATLGDDTTELSIELPTNGDWFIDTHYLWDCGIGSVEGLKCDYTLVGASSPFTRRMSTAFDAQTPAFAAAEQNGGFTADFNVVGVSGQVFIANDYMILTVASAPGTLLFRAAKNTEVGGADTIFLSGSYITAIKKAA